MGWPIPWASRPGSPCTRGDRPIPPRWAACRMNNRDGNTGGGTLMTTAGQKPWKKWWHRWKSTVLMVLITGGIGIFTGAHFGILAYSAFSAGRIGASLTWATGGIVISVVPPLTAYWTERPLREMRGTEAQVSEPSVSETAIPDTGE